MRAGLRRGLHALSPVVLLPAWWLGWEATAAFVLVLAIGAVVLEQLRLRLPAVRDPLERFLPVWRPHEREGMSGAGWLAVAYAIAVRAPIEAGLPAILAAAWADPAASLLGARFGRGPGKTIVGSLTVCVITTALAAGLGQPLAVAIVAGIAAAMLERWATAPDDNFWLAPGVALTLIAFA